MKKPDGYVHELWAVSKANKEMIALYPDSMGCQQFKPMCLVSPRYVEWVEKARKQLERTANLKSYSPLEHHGLLAELKEIEFEEVA